MTSSISAGSSCGTLADDLLDGEGGEVVGPALDERTLEGATDGGAAGGHDHCVRHGPDGRPLPTAATNV